MIIMGSNTEYNVKFYIKLPNNQLYVKEHDDYTTLFTRYVYEAFPFLLYEATIIAKELSLEVVKRTITTTTEISEEIIFGSGCDTAESTDI